MTCQDDLLQMIAALGSSRRFSRVLDSWQNRGNEQAENSDRDEKFGHRKAMVLCGRTAADQWHAVTPCHSDRSLDGIPIGIKLDLSDSGISPQSASLD